MTSSQVHRRVGAMLDAYETRIIDAGDLYARLLKLDQTASPEISDRGARSDLLAAVEEACDLGRDEREEIGWAAAKYWREAATRA